jgi:hypothetical protein
MSDDPELVARTITDFTRRVDRRVAGHTAVLGS